MIHDALVFQPMMRLAGDVDHVRTMAATGEANIGLTRLIPGPLTTQPMTDTVSGW
jgi:hypothetical protein